MGRIIPYIMENKNVSNHQPDKVIYIYVDIDVCWFITTMKKIYEYCAAKHL